jgi:hypothetical protein
MTRCRLAVLALAVPVSLAAQPDSVRSVVEGKIIDLSGAPLAQTEILWLGDRRSVLSRTDGSFSLTVPVRGQTVILVRRPGYNAQPLRVDLSSGSWRGEILLKRGAFQLPDLEVAAKYAKPAEYAGTSKFDDFFRRQKLGLGTFISREQIERMNAIHTLEILRGISGVYVDVANPGDPASAEIRMARCQGDDHRVGKVTVWIDGVRQIEQMGFDSGLHGAGSLKLAEMLSRVSASGIEMMEVYRGPSQIPGEFHWDGCAAIVIWTRYNPSRP